MKSEGKIKSWEKEMEETEREIQEIKQEQKEIENKAITMLQGKSDLKVTEQA